jgi:uncharacterized protein (TIGR03118 family)
MRFAKGEHMNRICIVPYRHARIQSLPAWSLVFLLCSASASAQYAQSNLVADRTGFGAEHVDPGLIDPWGIAIFPGGPFAVANARSGLITFYTHTGAKLPLEVTVPPAPGLPPGVPGSPTGIVLNSSNQFVIHAAGRSAPALLIVDTLDGLICGWNPTVDPTHAVILLDNSVKAPFPASYTALAFAHNSHGQLVLYAADSGSEATTSNNEIAMYDGDLKPIGNFGDSTAPSTMTVFGIQNVGGELYVTYAAFAPLNGGVVDVFNPDGQFLRRFGANGPGGPLEEPWAVVLAPDDYGRFGNALLVGNLGDGRINAYSAQGGFLGQLQNQSGSPISSGLGLWALVFRPTDTDHDGKPALFFASGVNNEMDGLFGMIVPAGQDK